MHGSLLIRSAQARDVDAIVQLVESSYRGDQSRRGWTTEADLLSGQRTDRGEVDAALKNTPGRSSTMLLGELDGELVGCLQLTRAGDTLAPSPQVGLGMFAIRPARQGIGLGKQLLIAAEAAARMRGAKQLRIEVIGQRQELIGWYQRRGFVPSGERAPFPYGQPRFGLPLRSDLYFCIMIKQL